MKKCKNHKKINKQKRFFFNLGCQMDKRETNSDYEMEKDNLQIFTLKKMF